MNHEIITTSSTDTNSEISLSKLADDARNYAKFAFSKATLKICQQEWQFFSSWCNKHQFSPLPSSIDTLIIYLTELANQKLKVSTIAKKLYAICKIHILNNHPLNLKDSNFILVWNGIKRSLGTAKKGRSPLLIKTLRDILSNIANNVIGIRDRALINFGWASAMRRSEITDLNWDDITFIDEGIHVLIRKSKTDQYGEGQKIAILYGNNPETCPILNLKKWQEISVSNEAVFTSVNKSNIVSDQRLSDRDVARILKKIMLKSGLDASEFAGHSLRSGFITTAAKHSVPEHIIMKHSRHKTAQMIQVYTRDNSLVKDNATSMVGL
jgi:integrase